MSANNLLLHREFSHLNSEKSGLFVCSWQHKQSLTHKVETNMDTTTTQKNTKKLIGWGK
jgi:hypothetical protein